MASEDRAIHRWLFVTQVRQWESGIKMTFTMESVGMLCSHHLFQLFSSFGKNYSLRKWMVEYQNAEYPINEKQTNKQKTEKTGSYSLLFRYFKLKHLWYTNTGSAPSHKSPDKNIDEIYGQPWEVWCHETTNLSLGNISLRKESPQSRTNICSKWWWYLHFYGIFSFQATFIDVSLFSFFQ